MKKDVNQPINIVQILTTMDEMFRGFPLTELHYRTPFQLLVAVMMSAQTTDKQVNKVNEQFFRLISRPEDIVRLGESGVGALIKTVGLRKSKTVNLVKMAQMICDRTSKQFTTSTTNKDCSSGSRDIRDLQWQYANEQELFDEWGYALPDTLDGLTHLPGVGIKTAKVVLYILYGQKRVAVDTHVHRVMNRLGIVQTKTPDQTSAVLETLIPDTMKQIAHRVIIYFGRYHCTAKRPRCTDCPFHNRCPAFRV